MNILYLGDTFQHSTSAHRAEALRRLGHTVKHVNPRLAIPPNRWISHLTVRLGFEIWTHRVHASIVAATRGEAFDCVWVDGCCEIGPKTYEHFRRSGSRIINYNVDDPFGPRDKRKWSLYKAGVAWHDLTVVVRPENIAEAAGKGAKLIAHAFRSFDPVAHKAIDTPSSRWRSNMVFVGTWMPERGEVVRTLIREGVPLRVWGDWWERAPEWREIRSHIAGPAIYGSDYVHAIRGASLALGLLSSGNRDRHTQRSAEIPYIGGAVLCAPYTDEHEMLLGDTCGAMLWRDIHECAARCLELLRQPERCQSIAVAAKNRIESWRLSNDEVIKSLLCASRGAEVDHALIKIYRKQG